MRLTQPFNFLISITFKFSLQKTFIDLSCAENGWRITLFNTMIGYVHWHCPYRAITGPVRWVQWVEYTTFNYLLNLFNISWLVVRLPIFVKSRMVGLVANHGELNNTDRSKYTEARESSTARRCMAKMVGLFRTKKLKPELLLYLCMLYGYSCSWQGRPASVRREDRRFHKQGGVGTG